MSKSPKPSLRIHNWRKWQSYRTNKKAPLAKGVAEPKGVL